MNLEPSINKNKKSALTRRSTSKVCLKLKSKKTHRFSTSIDENILKVYCRKQSLQLTPEQNLIQIKKYKKLETFKTKIKKLPDIKKSSTPSSKSYKESYEIFH